MKRLSLICFLSACAVVAEGCSNGGVTMNTGTGGGGGAGNKTGTGGGSAGNAGAGTGGQGTGGSASGGNGTGTGGGAAGEKGAGGIGGLAGTAGKGGAAGSGSAGTSGGGAGGARGGAGGGASQGCSKGNPCVDGKICVSYSCGPIGVSGGCTAPPPECIQNPCDAAVCDSCPSTLCLPFGGMCMRVDSADIACVMPG
jgi:hypothetical protein